MQEIVLTRLLYAYILITPFFTVWVACQSANTVQHTNDHQMVCEDGQSLVGDPGSVVYAFKVKGTQNHCSCTKKQYETLSKMEDLFETTIFTIPENK